jgi:hypothetical protein
MISLSLRRATATALFTLALPAVAHAQLTNVALGKSVSGFGEFGTLRPGSVWGPQPLAPFSSLTDGAMPAVGEQWQTGTVWWDSRAAVPSAAPLAAPEPGDTFIGIDLGSVFALTGFGLSFDNNDVYEVWGRATAGDSWSLLQTFTCDVNCSFGMENVSTPNILTSPFSARYLAVIGTGGDRYYSLGEVQAFANVSAVPEPASIGLLLLGVVGMGGTAVRRRRR